MSRSAKDEGINLVLSVDHDGVVRVVNCEAEQFLVTPHQLAKLLTGLLDAVLSTRQDENEVINVSMK